MSTPIWRDISSLLSKHTVISSSPCRVDCGGSTDHRLTGLVCRIWKPATTNIALNLRTTVKLTPYTPGKILIESQSLGQEERTLPNLPLTGSFGLLFAIAAYFGVHGLRLSITSQSPPQSGLGGSSAAAVATIGAISECLTLLGDQPYDLRDVALLAHNIEDSLYGNTGLQDQAAAIYGGVNLWQWEYGSTLNFSGQNILPDPQELDKHILVAYTGKPHPSSQKGSLVLKNFIQQGTLETLAQISEQARVFAEAVKSSDYEKAGQALLTELNLRSSLTSQILSKEVSTLVNIANKAKCGAKVTGHGGGGCVWTIGLVEAISWVKGEWEQFLLQDTAGYLLPSSVAPTGLQVIIK